MSAFGNVLPHNDTRLKHIVTAHIPVCVRNQVRVQVSRRTCASTRCQCKTLSLDMAMASMNARSVGTGKKCRDVSTSTARCENRGESCICHGIPRICNTVSIHNQCFPEKCCSRWTNSDGYHPKIMRSSTRGNPDVRMEGIGSRKIISIPHTSSRKHMV